MDGWGREILPQIYFADEAAGVVLEAAGAAVELAALVELPEFEEEEEPSLFDSDLDSVFDSVLESVLGLELP